jgi:hypothetical protein
MINGLLQSWMARVFIVGFENISCFGAPNGACTHIKAGTWFLNG